MKNETKMATLTGKAALDPDDLHEKKVVCEQSSLESMLTLREEESGVML